MTLRNIRPLSFVGIAALLVTASCRGGDPHVQKQQHFDRGEDYFKQGKYSEAAVEYQTAIKNDPRFGPAYFRLGEAYEKQENGAGALGAYVRAADLLADHIEAHLRAANYLIAARRFEDARTMALKVTEKDPKNVEAWILVGNASAGLNDIDRAIKELQDAQKLDPTDPRISTNLGWFEAAKGRSSQAEQVFRRAIALAPGSANAHLALANYLAATGRLGEAEESLHTAVTLEPRNVTTQRAFGWLLAQSNRMKEAEPFFVAAAQLDPQASSKFLLADFYTWSGRDPEAIRVLEELRTNASRLVQANTRLALIVARSNDLARARALVAEALKLAPHDADLRLVAAQVAADDGKQNEALAIASALAKEQPELAAAHFLEGRALASLGRTAEAQKAFLETLRLNPRAIPARLHLARLQMRDSRFTEARQTAEEVARLAPGNPASQLLIAEAMQASHDFAGADRLLTDLTKKYPDWAPAQAQMSNLAVARGDWARARQALARLESVSPGSEQAFEGRLAVAVGTKDFAGARRSVDERIAKNPKSERALLVGGQVWAATGDNAHAEMLLKELLTINPAQADAYDQLGQLYARTGRLAEAERQFADVAAKDGSKEYGLTLAAVLAHAQGKLDVARQRYESVLAVNPSSAVAANNLAWLYTEQGDKLDLALQWAQTAKRADPDNPNFIDTLGVVMIKKRLWDSAVAELRDAAGRAPKNPTIQLHLAQALAGNGKKPEARRIAERALQLDSHFPEADEARKIIAGQDSAATPKRGD